MPPRLNQVGGALMSAGGAMQAIPGIGNIAGAITGGLGFGLNLLDSILGKDTFDWKKWKNQGWSDIDFVYNKAKLDSNTLNQNLGDASMSLATNKSGMSSGIAGINNPGRVNAETIANISGQKDQRIASANMAFNQQQAGAKQQIADRAAQGESTDEHNAPSWRDYAGNIIQGLSTDPGQMFLGAVAGRDEKAGSWIGKMFQNKPNQPTNNVVSNNNPVINNNPSSFFGSKLIPGWNSTPTSWAQREWGGF